MQVEKANSAPNLLSSYTLLSRALLMQGKLDDARQVARHAAR